MKIEDCTDDEIFFKNKCRKISTIRKRHSGLSFHTIYKRLKPSEKKKWILYWKRIRQESDRSYITHRYAFYLYLIIQLIVVPIVLMIMISIGDRSWCIQWWWWCIYVFFIFLPRVVLFFSPYFSIFLFPKTKPSRQYWQHAGLSLFHWIVLLSPFLLLWSDHLWIRILINILIPVDAYLLLLFLGTLGL